MGCECRKGPEPTGERPIPFIVVAYLTHPDSLVDLVQAEPSYRVDQLREWLYRHPVLDPAEMTNLPKSLRESLDLWPFSVTAEQIGDGGLTRKWLFTAPDGADVEAVLMGY